MSNRVKFVGGPLDGQETHIWGTKGYCFPDYSDSVHVLLASGETAMFFGEHSYVAETYGRVAEGVREYIDQWEYAGYKPPVVPQGAKVIDLSDLSGKKAT